jgi:hypothetical protein
MIASPNEVRARAFGIALALSTLIGSIAVGLWLGLEVALLVVAAGALVLVIALLWSSVAGLSGDTPLSLDEALGMGAPSTEEEQKRAVLRALKDLDYERSVGKISEEDFHEFSERYRAEARRLIAAVDATLGPAHALAEKLAAERLAAEGLVSGASAAEPAKSPEPEPEPKSGAGVLDAEGDGKPALEKPDDAKQAKATRPEVVDAVEPPRPESEP